jgi:hypothetical protein
MEEEMKTYVLRDTVKAKLVTSVTAEQFFHHKPWPKQGEQLDGYLVEYNNGKQTWISKDDFEKNAVVYETLQEKLNFAIIEMERELDEINNKAEDIKYDHKAETALKATTECFKNYIRTLKLIMVMSCINE